MSTIRVAILDPTGAKKTRADVPGDVTAERLASALAARMGLPTVDQSGRNITYRLAYARDNEETEVTPDQTLEDVGVQNDDVIRLYADMQAGGEVFDFRAAHDPFAALKKSYYREPSQQEVDISDLSQIRTDINRMRDVLDNIQRQIQDSNKTMIQITGRLQEEIDRLRDVIYPSGSIDGIEELEDEVRHQITLRKELKRRLHALELEQAKKGIDTPPQVEMQINEIRERINEIEARIKIVTYDLERLRSGTSKE